MTKYVIAILLFIAVLAGFLLYVGDDAALTMTSTAEAGPFQFSPITLTWQAVIVFVTATVVFTLLTWTLLTWLWRLPSRIRSGVGLRRRNQALDAMEDALLAGADGDSVKAKKKAEKARNLIGSEDLGRIVSAQAAEASGDQAEAVAQYTAMLSSEKARATGQHGLARNLLACGDLPGAIEQAQIAYADNKNARWAFEVLFQAQMADYQWNEAAKTLEMGERRKHIDKDVARRRRAVLLSAEADYIRGTGQTQLATDMASRAASETPEFAPAVALAANLLNLTGDRKKAVSVIEKAWAKQPHPALAIALQDIIETDTPKNRAKRIEALIKANLGHRESHMLDAEEKLKAGDGVAALSILAPYLNLDSESETPTARLCQLAGQIEEKLGNMSDARLWYERAATAPLEADWSDLDPQGDAFDYSDADWRRLTFSFGETGELIHPRHEAGAPRRRPGLPEPLPLETEAVVRRDFNDVSQEGSVQTLGPDGEGKKDLSRRLDSLLDKPK
jgi:HemY protein